MVHLLELVRRVRTPEEAAAAINAAQKFALHRARRAQHSALSPELSSWLMRVRRGAPAWAAAGTPHVHVFYWVAFGVQPACLANGLFPISMSLLNGG